MGNFLKAAFVLWLFWNLPAFAVTKVGNGDDGSDLEGAVPLTSGPIVDARAAALEKMAALNPGGIPGLGMLMPELSRSTLYLAQKDSQALLPEDHPEATGAFHSDMRGLVYARTFARPHAATRFYPVAQALSRDQLVSLHVHEALHRSLPDAVREDEGIVAQLTLALTAPEATHDSVRAAGERLLPKVRAGEAMADEAFKAPSSVGYELRRFWAPPMPATFPIYGMHVLHSDLYPFGDGNSPFGLGLSGSFIQGLDSHQAGPLKLSAKMRLWSRRGFAIGLFGSASLNVLSAEELKNSPFGRDVYTAGISMRKDLRWFYVENFLSYDFAGTSTQSVGRVSYRYGYGGVVDAKVRAGARVGKFDLGLFGELHLADYFRIDGGGFRGYDSGRYRILSAGPEVSLTWDAVAFSMNARYLLDSTKNANFDTLGNLMGPGVSQGSVGASLSVFF